MEHEGEKAHKKNVGVLEKRFCASLCQWGDGPENGGKKKQTRIQFQNVTWTVKKDKTGGRRVRSYGVNPHRQASESKQEGTHKTKTHQFKKKKKKKKST